MIFVILRKLYFETGLIFRNFWLLILLFKTYKNQAMTVNIHNVHFEADVKLIEHVNKKISKLENHHDRIMKVDVFLKLDNVMHQIKDKVAEIRVKIPKSELFVKQSTKSFEESFDMALDSMLIQLKKAKEKQLA